MDFTALILSLQLALCTTVGLFVFGLPIAYWLSSTRWRGRFIVETIVALPLVLPPTVLGYYLLVATGTKSPLGAIYEQITGSTLAFSFAGILIGSLIGNLPFAVRPFLAAFSNIDRKLIEASWCLGRSQWQTFWKVTFPLARPGILAGLVLTFAHSLGEFGVVLMIGGNIPSVTRTLSIAIYDDVQALDYQSAARSSIGLLAIALVALLFSQYLLSRGDKR